MRFAFYGRVSTEDHQDEAASQGWQRRRASQLIEPHSDVIVTEFFDVGQSRSLPWSRRPQATMVLAELRTPNRGWDAIVVGEPARAFCGNQFSLTFPVIDHCGVEQWVPEVGGKVDPGLGSPRDAHVGIRTATARVEDGRSPRHVRSWRTSATPAARSGYVSSATNHSWIATFDWLSEIFAPEKGAKVLEQVASAADEATSTWPRGHGTSRTRRPGSPASSMLSRTARSPSTRSKSGSASTTRSGTGPRLSSQPAKE